MKRIGKMMSFIIALTMILVMSGMSVLAASISIERDSTYSGDSAAVTRVYTYYKIFDADYKTHTAANEVGSTNIIDTPESPVSYSIAVDNEWVGILGSWNAETKTWTRANGQLWFDLALSADGTKYLVTAADGFTDEYAQAAAEWLLAQAEEHQIAGTSLTYDETTKKWTSGNIDKGYYLVNSEDSGSNLILATTDMTLHEKSTYPSVDKKQNDTAPDAAYADEPVDVQVGDTIYYEIVVYVPGDDDADIVVTDTMSAGLTPAAAHLVTAKTGDSATAFDKDLPHGDGDANWASALSDHVYTFTIKPTELVKGKYVQLLLTATVNSTAILKNDADNKNDVKLNYHSYWDSDSVNFHIYATGAVKYDGATGVVDPDTNVLSPAAGKELEYLDGAEFVLVDSDGTTEIPVLKHPEGQYYYPKASEDGTAVNIVSVKNGTGVVIRGLDNQKYYLKEVTAPTGYNPLTDLVELTVEQDSTEQKTIEIGEKSKVKIANNAGTVLPSTGGMGTTLFYVIGSILVIGAGVLLVVRRRMNDR